MRWRLILEDHNPELIYIQGSNHIAVDTLSWLDIVDTKNPIKPNIISLTENFSLEKEDILHPVNYKTMIRYQQSNKSLIDILN